MTDNLTQTAPRRIWLQVDTDDEDRSDPFPDDVGVTWAAEPVGGAEVEYVRADIANKLLAALEDVMDTGFTGGPQGKRARAAIAKFQGAS